MNTQFNSLKYGLLACGGAIVILLIIIAALLARGGFGGEQTRFSPAIEAVLAQDATTSSGAKNVAEVVQRMRLIDTSGCPNEFRSAYLSHIQAWEGLAVVEQHAVKLKQDSESVGAYVEALIRGVMMDPFGKANEVRAAQTELERQAQAASEQIRLTFNQVEQSAVLYGASLTKR